MKTDSLGSFSSALHRIGVALLLALLPFQARATINVISHWRMGEADPGAANGASAVTLIDSTGTDNLTCSGSPAYSNDVSPVALDTLDSTLSVDFAGNSFATGPVVSTVQNNFGMEAWIKPASVSTGQIIAYNGRTDTAGWGLLIDGNRQGYAGLFGGVDIPGDDIGSATPGVWSHVAMVCDGGNTTIYVNGHALSYVSTAIPNLPNTGFAMSCDPQNTAGDHFTGLIDEVRVFTFNPGQFSLSDLWPDSLPINLPPSNFSIGANNLLEGPNAGSDSVLVSVLTPPEAWTLASTASWLHVSTNQAGTASGTVIFSFDANSGAERVGSLVISNQTLTVTQAPAGYFPATGPAVPLVFSNLANPQGIAVDSGGDVYVADSGHNAIEQWDYTDNTLYSIVTNSLNAPHGIAIDVNKNIYVADTTNNSFKEFTSGGQLLTNFAMSAPKGVAVDSLGNVYIADTAANDIQVWKPSVPSLGSLGASGLNAPAGVAVDVSSNVYIADTGNNAIKEWIYSSHITISVVTGLNAPQGVAVDGGGNVYIADTGNNAVKVWSPVNGLSALVSTNLNSPRGVAVDSAGNVYIADSGNNAVKEFPRAFVQSTNVAFSFAAANGVLPAIEPPSPAFSLSQFLPSTDESWLTITGVTNGVAGFDAAALNGNPRTAHINELGVISTVTESPVFYIGTSNLVEGPGAGKDSVVLAATPPNAGWTASANATWLHLAATNQSGVSSTNEIFSFDANTGATRVGTLTIAGQTLTVTQAAAPYVSAPVAITTLISGGLDWVQGIAVDPLGNVFATSEINNYVYTWSPANNSVSALSIGDEPDSIAADGSGGFYLNSLFAGDLIHHTASGGNTQLNLNFYPFFTTMGMDREGNYYLSDNPYTNENICLLLKCTPSGVVTTLSSGPLQIYGISADAAGNLYLATSGYVSNGNYVYSTVNKLNQATGQLTQLISGATSPQMGDIANTAVDGSGNVYVVDGEGANLTEWVAATGQYILVANDHAGSPGAEGVAVDPLGNVFYSDQGHEIVAEIPRALIDPTAKTESGSSGSDALSQVLPAAENLQAPFAPTSDSPWLTITGVANGIVTYNFTTNPTVVPRVARITLLGQSIQVTQAGAPPSIINAMMPGHGVFQFGITNIITNATVTVLSTTNLNTALANWTTVGVASNAGPGLMQFIDTHATNTSRFYTILQSH